MRISDWSSDVCSSDLFLVEGGGVLDRVEFAVDADAGEAGLLPLRQFLAIFALAAADHRGEEIEAGAFGELHHAVDHLADRLRAAGERSEEHTSELQSLMRISYDVFCLKQKKKQNTIH